MATPSQTLIFLTIFALLSSLPTAAQQPSAPMGGSFREGYQQLIEADSSLANNGGAAIIESNGQRFFIAVGVTVVRGDAPSEKIRQLRVAKINALRTVAEFIEPTKVFTETKLSESNTIVTSGTDKKGRTEKKLEEVTRTSIQGVIQAPEQVGSWTSADGKLFFIALGKRLSLP